MRIAICGSFGVGKTTLINKIEYKNKIVDLERQIKNINPTDNPEEFNLAVFNSIIGAENIYDSFITNTSHIDNLAYMLKFAPDDFHYYKNKTKPYDLIFYIPIEFPLKKDGYRYEDEKLQRQIDYGIRLILDHIYGGAIILRGSLDSRVEQFNKVIKEYEKN